ncbi:Metallo-dependent phosphatase-like protein [Pelagophyceae sp. CCMP2097]|nr:Metallo-dependent phosphatase-like protein [Pelagophyceae sp. CCMP2097]|mmetsp:Transcript_31347/g.105569  ORF Transcript_31347/g.105569 Transcript_31347/m.105569 type:complete len:355 (+) Transcript_31347:176-1240(+)
MRVPRRCTLLACGAGGAGALAPAGKPLFRFGVIGDVQYANVDDGLNYIGTRTRRYRQSLSILEEAAAAWGAAGVDFCVELGDIVDGQARTARAETLNDLNGAMNRAKVGKWHIPPGNHELYVFGRPELHASLLSRAPGPDELYYSFSPAPGWRCLVLDSYELSVIGAVGGTSGRRASAELLAQHNPNINADEPNAPSKGGWLQGMDRKNFRWVPYNGGFSDKQLSWFERTLESAQATGERVCVFCHSPVHEEASKPHNLPWNYEKILEALDRKKGVVQLFFAGHDHDGGFASRGGSEFHITPPAPLECEVGEKAYGRVDVYDDRAVLNWCGKTPIKSKDPWPSELFFAEAKQPA